MTGACRKFLALTAHWAWRPRSRAKWPCRTIWKGLAPPAAFRRPLSHLRPEADLAAVSGAQAGDETFVGLTHAEVLDTRRDRSALEQVPDRMLLAALS